MKQLRGQFEKFVSPHLITPSRNFARFNLHQLQFQRTKASCVEVVALIRRVCFYTSSKNEWSVFRTMNDIKFCKKLDKLSLDMKPGAFSMIPKANDRVSNGNSWNLHGPRKFACRNHKWRQFSSLSSISRALFTLNSFHKARQSARLIIWRYWSCYLKLNFYPVIGFFTITKLQRSLSLSSNFWPKNGLLKWNTHSIPLICLWITSGCFRK